MSDYISMWPATGTPKQYMSLVGYDRPPLQAPSINIPYKNAVTCRNRAWTGPLPIAAGWFWHESDTSRHPNIGCRSCRAKKCHIWWWSTQALGVYWSLVAESRHICHMTPSPDLKHNWTFSEWFNFVSPYMCVSYGICFQYALHYKLFMRMQILTVHRMATGHL